MLTFAESGHTQYSEPQIHWPEVSSKAKAVENCRSTIVPTWNDYSCFFAHLLLSISSVITEQSQKCVKNMNLVTREDPSSENSRVPLSCPMWWTQTCPWTMMILHIKNYYCTEIENELKNYYNKTKLSKFCTDAAFLTVVDIGQFFMTKDTEEISQLTDAVACREYTSPRDENTSEPKGWIRGNTKIVPVLEVATCCPQGKYGWSRTWTTTSRKPQKCSSKKMR